jgi:hypothetical protein
MSAQLISLLASVEHRFSHDYYCKKTIVYRSGGQLTPDNIPNVCPIKAAWTIDRASDFSRTICFSHLFS